MLEIECPEPGNFDTSHSFMISGLNIRTHDFKSIKSRLKVSLEKQFLIPALDPFAFSVCATSLKMNFHITFLFLCPVRQYTHSFVEQTTWGILYIDQNRQIGEISN